MSTSRITFMLLAVTSGQGWAAVEVTGIEGEVLENVQEYLTDQPGCAAEQETVRRYADELPERLRPALDAFGRYKAEITVEILQRSDGCWRIRAGIDPGPVVVVRDVAVGLAGAAEADESMATLFRAFPLSGGQPLHHAAYQTFKDRVEVLARQRGYLEARFTEQRIDVYVDESAADVALRFDSGPRYRFGNVSFDTDALDAEVMRSFLGFEEGDPYDAELVGRLQRELTASQYFIDANVTADFGAASDGRIPVRIEAIADRPVSYTVGGGYSTDDGPRLRFSYDNERRNRAGHQIHAEALLAQVRQTVTFDYRVPVGNPQRDWRSYRFGLAREDILAGVSLAARFGIRRTRASEALTVTRFVDVIFERDDVAGFDFSSQMLVPGISWVRNYRDDLARPREGHRASFVASAGIGSDVRLLRLDMRAKWVRATPWDGRVLIRGRAGALFEDGDFVFVPLSMRFFAGGDNSVRGYDFESLGPLSVFGELIGGNRLLEASLEYEHPLLEDWSAAVFIDSGNAFRDSGFDPQTGVGIGARWFSPIGPVRFDVAWPLDGSDRSPELHISIGPDL